jgi:hypothetical protein
MSDFNSSDCISRQAAIDVAVEAADEWDGGHSRNREEIITRKMRMLPSVQPHWIPCSECLPEDSDYRDLWETPDGAVLWCKATGEIGIGWYYESTKNWCDLWDNGVKDVIAWMPLPEPYKGEQNE